MAFTAADVITQVRDEVQDTSVADQRYVDNFLLGKVNMALARMVVIRPDLFATIVDMPCVAGIFQKAPDDSVRVMDVLGNTSGAAVREVNKDAGDARMPTWPSMAGGPTRDWSRYVRDPNRFIVYPPATVNDTLKLMYARFVRLANTAETIPLADAYLPVVTDGTVWLVESVDNEAIDTGRAKMFKDAFEGALQTGLTARRITDPDTSGMDKGEVI